MQNYDVLCGFLEDSNSHLTEKYIEVLNDHARAKRAFGLETN